jgi:hypothetical protein
MLFSAKCSVRRNHSEPRSLATINSVTDAAVNSGVLAICRGTGVYVLQRTPLYVDFFLSLIRR